MKISALLAILPLSMISWDFTASRWLMPIHEIGAKNRKGSLGSPYAVKDYYAVNSEFGSLDDLKHFVKTAHDLGLYVILDWVANHTAWDLSLIHI